MKLGSCIHLEELRSTLHSILRLDLLFTVHCLLSSFCVKVIFSETIRARAMKLGSCIHLSAVDNFFVDGVQYQKIRMCTSTTII